MNIANLMKMILEYAQEHNEIAYDAHNAVALMFKHQIFIKANGFNQDVDVKTERVKGLWKIFISVNYKQIAILNEQELFDNPTEYFDNLCYAVQCEKEM